MALSDEDRKAALDKFDIYDQSADTHRMRFNSTCPYTNEKHAFVCAYELGMQAAYEKSAQAATGQVVAICDLMAAFSAAMRAQEMGYDAIAAIEALPELLAALAHVREWLQGSEPHRAKYFGELLAKAKGKK